MSLIDEDEKVVVIGKKEIYVWITCDCGTKVRGVLKNVETACPNCSKPICEDVSQSQDYKKLVLQSPYAHLLTKIEKFGYAFVVARESNIPYASIMVETMKAHGFDVSPPRKEESKDKKYDRIVPVTAWEIKPPKAFVYQANDLVKYFLKIIPIAIEQEFDDKLKDKIEYYVTKWKK